MTFVKTIITGYTDFGGYLSVDGNPAIRIENDCTYELDPGKHVFRIYSDIANANALKLTPDIPASQEGEEPVAPQFLDPWVFMATVNDNECLVLTLHSNGEIVDRDPEHSILKIGQRPVDAYLDELKRLYVAPRFHGGLTAFGIVLFFFGLILFCGFTEMAMTTADPGLLVSLGMTVLGFIMILAGLLWKKKKKK